MRWKTHLWILHEPSVKIWMVSDPLLHQDPVPTAKNVNFQQTMLMRTIHEYNMVLFIIMCDKVSTVHVSVQMYIHHHANLNE